MWELKTNYGRKVLHNRCPMCQLEVDTTEHVLEFNKGDMESNSNDERKRMGSD